MEKLNFWLFKKRLLEILSIITYFKINDLLCFKTFLQKYFVVKVDTR